MTSVKASVSDVDNDVGHFLNGLLLILNKCSMNGDTPRGGLCLKFTVVLNNLTLVTIIKLLLYYHTWVKNCKIQ